MGWEEERHSQAKNTSEHLDPPVGKSEEKWFGHLMRRADSLERTLMLGKIEGGRREQQRMRWVDENTDAMDVS